MSTREEKVLEVAARMQQKASTKLGHLSWAFLLRGILILALAACALFWPQKTMGILIKLLGAYFILDGLMALISARRAQNKTSFFIQAVISLAGGLVLLLWSDISAKVFLILVGIWILLQGLGILLSSWRMEKYDDARGPMATLGAVLASVGLVFIIWPDSGVVAASWMIAVGALVVGGILVFLGIILRRMRVRVTTIRS